MSDFQSYLERNNRFQSYLYSYPHKTAYRYFEQKLDLKSLWQNERKETLYLYTHIPFCRMRCAFCNLFTLSNPQEELIQRYLDQLQVEAEVMREVLGEFAFSGYAIGGGTPSHLSLTQLEQLFAIYQDILGVDLRHTPGSFELSPDTTDEGKLRFLAQQGLERVSIGIQSFVESEARSVGRIMPEGGIDAVLDKIAAQDFPVFNLDLIYGIAGQTMASWLASLEHALRFDPDELFLYPLYVRPQTTLFIKGMQASCDQRSELYAAGRDYLLAQGYEQDSMRLFRKKRAAKLIHSEYTCQEDGMIGLGTNARSYTSDVHYSTDYAVAKPNIAGIIQRYVEKDRADFAVADYGIRLSEADRKRRYLIKSLLKAQGLDLPHYRERFAQEALSDFPVLLELQAMGLADQQGQYLRLNQQGMSYSDLIGHWFISPDVRQKMEQYVVK